MFNGEVVFIK